MPFLELDQVTLRFGGLTAVSDFSLNMEKGELVGLIGPNGAGKTTIFNIITGVYRPTSGEVLFGGERISGMRPDLVCRRGITRTFQNIRLFSDLSVMDNVMAGYYQRLGVSTLANILNLPNYRRQERLMREECIGLLGLVGLSDAGLIARKATGLPYGMQRRLEIARALATKPTVLLLDEPAAGMSPEEARDLMVLITKIQKDLDLTILLVEHTMMVVMGICPKIVVINYGKTIAEGCPEEIQSNTAVIEAYLGKD